MTSAILRTHSWQTTVDCLLNYPHPLLLAWLFTQIHHKIILFILFWDVLWIINDLLAPLSLFFHEFQQNSQVFTDNIKRSISVGALTIMNIPIYIKISSFKSLIYINYFDIFTEILILKTILVFLKLMQLI